MAGGAPLAQGFVGRRVTRCVVDVQFFGLEFHEGGPEPLILRIEGVFQLQAPDGAPVLLRQEQAVDVQPALALLGAVVSRVRADERGGLRLDFRDGRSLVVDPDARFEPWEAQGPGWLVVSVAGGGLAVFDQPPRTVAPDDPSGRGGG